MNPYEPADAWIRELERKARGFEPPVDLAASVAERTGIRALEQMDQIERLSRNLRFSDEIALRARPGFDQLVDKLSETTAMAQKHAAVFETTIGKNLDLALRYPIKPLEDWHIPLKTDLPKPIFAETLFKDAFAELKQMATELMALHKSVRQALPVHWSRDWKFWLPVIISVASLAVAIFRH